MSKYITFAQIKALAPCDGQLREVKRLFGTRKRILVTVKLAESLAGRFNFCWLASHTLRAWADYDRTWADYDLAVASARADYDRAVASARADYHRATASARADYDRAGADYDRTWADYHRATASAWADYDRAVASAWARAYINQ